MYRIIPYLLFCLFAAQPVSAESPWPMFRHDLQHTGRTDYAGPSTPAVNWVFNASGPVMSSPSIAADGTIYFGTNPLSPYNVPQLYAIRPDCAAKWTFKTSDGIFSSAALLDNGLICFGSLNDTLYAIRDRGDAAELQWKFPTGLRIYSSPAAGPEGNLYFGSLDFGIYALDLSGNKIWNKYAGWCVFSSPAVGLDGTMYIGSKDECLYAFRNNVNIWQFRAGEFYDGHLMDSSPAVGPDGTIYIGADQYGASGFQPETSNNLFFFAVKPNGILKWSFEMEDGVESSPAIGSDGTIYVGSYDGYLYAITDAGNKGVLKWKYKTGGIIDASPTVDGLGRIYIGSRDSTMYAFEPDGSLLWSFRADGQIESSASIDARGHLYFGTFAGSLYSLGTDNPQTGMESADAFPAELELYGNYPNPFNASTTIRYALPQAAEVSIRIFDVSGRQVAKISRGPQAAGIHDFVFDASGMTSGLYFVEVTAGAASKTGKVLLVK